MRSLRLGLSALMLLAASESEADETLDRARKAACDLGGPADFISIIQHGDALSGEEAKALVADQAAGWPDKFSAYAKSPEARLLVAYARAVDGHAGAGGIYPPEACRLLKPLYKNMDDAERLAGYGIGPGASLLFDEDAKAGTPSYLSSIGERCEYLPYDVPVRSPCE